MQQKKRLNCCSLRGAENVQHFSDHDMTASLPDQAGDSQLHSTCILAVDLNRNT